MTDLFDLSGRVAVVTGASKGIGRMIADGLVRRGVRVHITARHADVCLHTAEELSAHGECIAIPNDLGSLDGVHELAAELKRRESKLDILVNNAATGWVAPFEEFPEKGWDKTLNLNLKAVFFLIQQLAPLLRAGRERGAARQGHQHLVCRRSLPQSGSLLFLQRGQGGPQSPDPASGQGLCPGSCTHQYHRAGSVRHRHERHCQG